MILLRLGFAVAALATGMIAGVVFYKAPAANANAGAYQLVVEGRLADAAAVYSDQIRRSPKDYLLYMRRALVLSRSGQADQALSDFDTALRLSPPVLDADALGDRLFKSALPETHAMAMVMELHTERAGIFESRGRYADALTDLDAAVALNSHNGATRHHRAIVRAYSGEFVGAEADFDAILARGMNLDSLFGRGVTKYLAGDWEAAGADFARAVKLAPLSGSYAVWLLKAELRDHQPIPLDQFNGLPKSNPAWARIDAFLSDYDTAQAATMLQARTQDNPARACEASALYGEWLEIKAAGDGAAALFGDVLAHCAPATLPNAVATFELKRLQSAATLARADIVKADLHQ